MVGMGYVDCQSLSFVLPDGRVLFDDASFRVGDGTKTALVGANGTGKTTLLRIIAGDLVPSAGQVARDGGLGVMRQFIGSIRDDTEVRDLLLDLAPPGVREAGRALEAAELAMMELDNEKSQMKYANALSDWGDAHGYDAEVQWDVCTMAALGMPYDKAMYRKLHTLSGGEQKRLALEALLRGPDQVLLLDEPDNYLDVPGKRWLEAALAESPKTVLFVSHDRELLHNAATRVVTIEARGAWVHGAGFGTYPEARQARRDRLAELHKRWDEERERLRKLVITLREQAKISPDMASRYSAMKTRFEKFEQAGPPPEQVVDQKVVMKLRGGRTGVRAITAEQLELTGLMKPFDLEVFYGERVAVLGSNGSGKSHFLRLLAGQHVTHTGVAKLGARVVAGWFAQTHEQPELLGKTLAEVLHRGEGDRRGLERGQAIGALRRYELQDQAD
jgi:ATPase subunit of ABC transporter with duplicated ATPase domains